MIFEKLDLTADGYAIVETAELRAARDQLDAANKRALQLELELYNLRMWQQSAPQPRPVRALGMGPR